jgi:hypothetical protein
MRERAKGKSRSFDSLRSLRMTGFGVGKNGLVEIGAIPGLKIETGGTQQVRAEG